MKKIALIFPGQGAEYVGMGKSLSDEYPVAKQTFEEANDILGFDLKKLCFHGRLSELSRAVNMLLAVFTCSVAAFRVYMQEIGIPPSISGGHSLGEYTALACSGAIEFADALKIVRKRGLLVEGIIDQGISNMTVVNGITAEIADEECKKISVDGYRVSIACFNSPTQVAISGYTEALIRVEDILTELGATATALIGSAPYHCPLMQPVSEKLQKELAKYSFQEFNWPVISNTTVLAYSGPEQIVENLAKQIASPVQWTKTLAYMVNIGVEIIIEIGPKEILSHLIREALFNITTVYFGQKQDKHLVSQLIHSYSV